MVKVIDASNKGNSCGGDFYDSCYDIASRQYNESLEQRATGRVLDHFIIHSETEGIVVFPQHYQILVRSEEYLSEAVSLAKSFEERAEFISSRRSDHTPKIDFYIIQDWRNDIVPISETKVDV